MIKLQEVIISITGRCNLKCRMCDIPLARQEECPTGTWKKVIDDAAALGAATVVFSGGEPLLRQDLLELIAYVKGAGMQACVTSNGLLIDARMASLLAGCGVNVVNISLEGNKAVHDFLRGEGSFDKAREALAHLKDCKVESTVAATVSAYNYQELASVVELARDAQATTVKFQPFSSLFLKEASGAKDFFIPPAEREKLKRCIADAAQLCKAYGIATNPLAYLMQIPEYLASKERRGRKGCNALFASCPITANGLVYPCWMLNADGYVLGKITESSLREIWLSPRRMLLLEGLRSDGCPGCMMSCYDREFGGEDLETRVSLHVNRIRHKGIACWMGITFRSLKRRFAFYRSYRGPLSKVLRRIFRAKEKKERLRLMSDRQGGQIRQALQEIAEGKARLQNEMKRHAWK